MGLSKGKTRLLERLKHPKYRARERAFLVEGIRGAQEFLGSRMLQEIRFCLVSPRLTFSEPGRRLKKQLEASAVSMEEIPDPELDAASDTEHPQGVVLVVGEPEYAFPPVEDRGGERILILDGIQDPGNAGTLVRAGRAFGLSRVIALEGTADLFNPKAVRASAGALSHLPVHRLSWSEAEGWLKEGEIPLLVGGADGTDIRDLSVPPRWALAIGNEGEGCRSEVRTSAAELVAVPMEPGVDSLNAGVAGAILMFCLKPSPEDRTEN